VIVRVLEEGRSGRNTGKLGGVAAIMAALVLAVAVAVAVAGGVEAPVPQGSILAEASKRLGLRPSAGDLVSVTARRCVQGAFPGRVLVNGRSFDAAMQRDVEG